MGSVSCSTTHRSRILNISEGIFRQKMLSVHFASNILKEHVSETRYLHRRVKGWGRTYYGRIRVDASPLFHLGTNIEPVPETCYLIGN